MAVIGIAAAFALIDGFRAIGSDHVEYLLADAGQIATLRLNYALVATVNHHPLSYYWSLMVEEHFYLVLPAFLLLVSRKDLRLALLWAIIIAASLARPFLAGEQDVGAAMRTIVYTSHFAVDFLAAGVLVALWAIPDGVKQLDRYRVPIRILGAGLMLMIFGLGRAGANLFTYAMPLLLAVAALLVLLAAIDRQLLFPAGIAATVLGYIGSRSYGIYLLHYPVLLSFRTVPFFALMGLRGRALVAVELLFVALITVALAEVCYRVIERPCIARGAALAASMRDRPSPVRAGL